MHEIRPERLLALAVAFLAGCIQAPPIRVIHTPQPWERWQYACMKPDKDAGPEDVAAKANLYGREGWGLAASDGTLWCFKRPVGSGATPMSSAPSSAP
jgi:hypothetical protein